MRLSSAKRSLVQALASAGRLGRAGFLLAFFASLLAGTGACRLRHPHSSAVAQGRYFATGHPDYDAFFVRLFRLQVALEQAPKTLSESRAAIAVRLGLSAGADDALLRSRLQERDAELKTRNVRVKLERSSSSGVPPALAVSGEQNPADAELTRALTQSFAQAAGLEARLPHFQRELDELPAEALALEQRVQEAFVGKSPGTHTEVRQNLADAQKVMGLMGPRLKQLEVATRELLSVFDAAFAEAAPPPPPPAETTEAEPPPEKKRSRPKPSKGAARPPAAKPIRETEPSAPARPKAQGPAKPDFEP